MNLIFQKSVGILISPQPYHRTSPIWGMSYLMFLLKLAGPFAIPAAKKNCTVFANNLNPESHKWLVHNCKLNKVNQKVKVFNLDGKDFLQGPVREELMQQLGLLSKKENTLSTLS